MANAIVDPNDPDYCETCGGECVAGCEPDPESEAENAEQDAEDAVRASADPDED
jgi:hypothetical protein